MQSTLQTISVLKAKLESRSSDAQYEAAYELVGRINSPEVEEILRAALLGPDDDIRQFVTDAITDAHSKSVPFLRLLLKSGRSARLTAIDLLGNLGADAGSAAPDLIAILEKSTNDDDRTRIEVTLGQIGDPAMPLLEPLLRSPWRQMALAALSQMAGEPSVADPDRLVALLSTGLSLPCDLGCANAIEALGRMGPRAAPASPKLLALLDPSVNEYWPAAAYALGRIGAEGPKAVPILRNLLTTRSDSGIDMIALALGQFGPQAAPAVPDLELALSSQNKNLRENAAEALGEIGASAARATGSLSAALSDNEANVRRHAADSLGRIADGLLSAAVSYDDREIGGLLGQLRIAADRARRGVDLDQYPNRHGQTVASLTRAAVYLEDVLRARRTARLEKLGLTIATVSIAIAGALIAVLVARIRWYLLTLLGRRWSFVAGTCSMVAEISQDRILLRSVQDARATAIRFPLNGWPPEQSLLEELRSAIPEASNLLVVADDVSFRQPWGHALGTEWSYGQKATIAGQVCISAIEKFPHLDEERRLRFQGLGCESASGMTPLTAVADEIAAVSASFRLWGAAVDSVNTNAGTSDLSNALCTADVVHVAAHADGSGIYLADGIFGMELFLSTVRPKLRCRLLVLSACEAGRIDDEHSLVYQMVQAGVNVIASLSLVRDFVCWTLFEEFYRAMLPRKSAQGISLGEGMRAAALACAKRFQSAEASLRPRGAQRERWKTSINAFLLYGDPSVRLVLLKSRKSEQPS